MRTVKVVEKPRHPRICVQIHPECGKPAREVVVVELEEEGIKNGECTPYRVMEKRMPRVV